MIISSRIRPVVASSVMAVAIIVTMVEPAFAQSAGIETVLQNIVDMLTGNIAKLALEVVGKRASVSNLRGRGFSDLSPSLRTILLQRRLPLICWLRS